MKIKFISFPAIQKINGRLLHPARSKSLVSGEFSLLVSLRLLFSFCPFVWLLRMAVSRNRKCSISFKEPERLGFVVFLVSPVGHLGFFYMSETITKMENLGGTSVYDIWLRWKRK